MNRPRRRFDPDFVEFIGFTLTVSCPTCAAPSHTALCRTRSGRSRGGRPHVARMRAAARARIDSWRGGGPAERYQRTVPAFDDTTIHEQKTANTVIEQLSAAFAGRAPVNIEWALSRLRYLGEHDPIEAARAIAAESRRLITNALDDRDEQ